MNQKTRWNEIWKGGAAYGRDPCELAKWAVFHRAIPPTSRILEPGCGTGRNSIFFAKNGLRVTGVDSSENALKIADEEARKAGVEISWVLADITNIKAEFKDAVFDAVFSNYCLHLLSEPERYAAVGEINRLLVVGGIVVASLLSTEDDGFRKGREVAPNTYEVDPEGEPGKIHYFFTEAAARLLFSKFDILELQPMSEFELIREGKVRLTQFWRLVAQKGGEGHD